MIFAPKYCSFLLLGFGLKAVVSQRAESTLYSNPNIKRGDWVVVGAQSDKPQPRLEIHDLYDNHPVQFSLFIRGLNQFMAMNYTDPLSYHQIANLHGLPLANFSNVADECGKDASCGDGYGTHMTSMFLPWHRAYIALIEQRLQDCAIEQARLLNDDEYTAAALTLRLPYWDWATQPANGDVFPSCFTTPSITIQGPDGSESVSNPLFSYKFPASQRLQYSMVSTIYPADSFCNPY